MGLDKVKQYWTLQQVRTIILLFVFLSLCLTISKLDEDNRAKMNVKDAFERLSKEHVHLLYPPFFKKCIDVIIKGAIKFTGKYSICSGLRLNDLIDLAGGFTNDVDIAKVPPNFTLKSRKVYYINSITKN